MGYVPAPPISYDASPIEIGKQFYLICGGKLTKRKLAKLKESLQMRFIYRPKPIVPSRKG